MATRSRYHLPPLDLLVLFVFDQGSPSVWITNLATGETTRTTGGSWHADRRTNAWSDRTVCVHVCAINPPRGTPLWLRGTRSGDHMIDAPTMSFELTSASQEGMCFTLSADEFPIAITTGNATNHSDWYADLTTLPGPGIKMGPKPPPPNPLPPETPIPTERFIHGLLTSPRLVEHIQRIIDARVAAPSAEHLPLREDLAALAATLLEH